MTVKPIQRPAWLLFDDEEKECIAMNDKNAEFVETESMKARREKRDCRNALMRAMSSELGLSARQIATTFMVDDTGNAFFVPGEKQCPNGLAGLAKEYIQKWRGTEPGFLIRRLVVREGANVNNPLLIPDVEGVISGKYDEKRAKDPRLLANRDKQDQQAPDQGDADIEPTQQPDNVEPVELIDRFATAALTGLTSALDRDALSQEGWTDVLATGAYAIAKAMARQRKKVLVD